MAMRAMTVMCLGLGLACGAPDATSQRPVAPASAPSPSPAAQAQAAPGPKAPAAEQEPQATSLLGEALGVPPLAPEALTSAQQALDKARQAYGDQPNDVMRLVRLGRAFAGVGKYKEAVALFTVGLKQHPDQPHLLRHRGHRFITLRQFDLAVADLERAAELIAGKPDEPEPPLVPSPSGVVLDTFHENVHYHLALAHYLRGEWEAALAGWQATARCVQNDDGRVMVAHWTWLTLQRLGRAEDAEASIAAITPELEVVEYHGYHDAVLVYRGLLDPGEALAGKSPAGPDSVEFATLGYGIAQWHLAHGRREEGAALLKQVAGAEMWPAFGRIAAEADLARAAKAEPGPEPAPGPDGR
jgi:tetratricopeptide (TPR) repeat protein